MNTFLKALQALPSLSVLTTFLFLAPSAGQAQFTYTTANGTVTITGYTGPGGAITIPSTITGLPVTRIGNGAFIDRTTITGVTIPNSVLNIGYAAFERCYGLRSVTLGNTVTYIDNKAFRFCTNLTSVTIPDSVRHIGAESFVDCRNLTSVTMGNSVTNIGYDAFAYCYKLATVTTLPASVILINATAFSLNPELTAITVSALNPKYSSLEGVLFDKGQTRLIKCPGGKTGSFAIPNTVTNIGDFAFQACHRLTSVSIPNGVTVIGMDAFSACVLTNVTIPSTVTVIDKETFAGCQNLVSVTIPDSVTNIYYSAFASCTSLRNLTIPASVRNIDDGAFSFCSSLTGVFFQGNAPVPGYDGHYLFQNASNVTVYYRPDTTGWGATFGDRPTVLWNPRIETGFSNFGVHAARFGFSITGTANIPIVIEAAMDLSGGAYAPLQSCTLTNGSIYFSDPQWYSARFYRIRSP